MQDYLAEHWRELLRSSSLQTFDDWWQKKVDWFEPPNMRRGGWSGVSRLVLGDEGRAVFLKRQENHVFRNLAHPFRGMPTFSREMENILTLQKAGVPALTPVYFAQRNADGVLRAILVTEALAGFVALNTVVPARLSFAARHKLIEEVTRVLNILHRNKLAHNCLYPKHLFVKAGEGGYEVRLIDLEKARKCWRSSSAMFRDLDTLNRHAHGFTRTDRLRFLMSYLNTDARDKRLRKLWVKLVQRENKKKRRHQ